MPYPEDLDEINTSPVYPEDHLPSRDVRAAIIRGVATSAPPPEPAPSKLIKKTRCDSCERLWSGHRKPQPHRRRVKLAVITTRCSDCDGSWPGDVEMPEHTRRVVFTLWDDNGLPYPGAEERTCLGIPWLLHSNRTTTEPCPRASWTHFEV